MKTVRICVMKRRKDGSHCHRNGRVVWVRVPAPLIARDGAWAITPFHLNAEFTQRYNITHIPTGRCVFGWISLSLPKARKALREFARLPDQARWRRLKHPRHKTKAMIAAGVALRDRLAH